MKQEVNLSAGGVEIHSLAAGESSGTYWTFITLSSNTISLLHFAILTAKCRKTTNLLVAVKISSCNRYFILKKKSEFKKKLYWQLTN